ncbi:PhoH family protein [Halanaerobiaceae bacterium Z-7014]|uniref:PhoH-like protein n=1 Tax=Halonatronomonas betaini TaxID=2778430 RepID=A0A931APC9_9FIRM|nr:PhoH family protein [Halonatronomonas betaini]
MSNTEEIITVNNYDKARNIFGQLDDNLKIIEDRLDVKIISRGTEIKIQGDKEDVFIAKRTLEEMLDLQESDNPVNSRQLKYIIEQLQNDSDLSFKNLYDEVLQVNYKGREIKAKTLGQKIYIDAMKRSDIVFGIGPAGTGKTYLAVVMAVKNLLNNNVNRIVLTRPAIEAGENLGFLPGDMQEKVDPYLRPLYDSLFDVLGPEKVNSYMEKDIIEVAPLAYMRGRTLDDSFIILDEAQNTTSEQMKMMLTRIGFNSRAVITGDITQVDLPYSKKSGLGEVEKILAGIHGIDFIYLDETDVVRHNLVRKIISAYEESGK